MLEPFLLALIIFISFGGFKSKVKKLERKEKYTPWLKVLLIKDD